MLTCQTAGHYRLSCNKGILLVRLRGTRKLLRFQAQDRVGFRFEPGFLIVEDVRTLAVRRKVSWEQIESVTAGEPESDNAELFQG
jgi:hypothetical protein